MPGIFVYLVSQLICIINSVPSKHSSKEVMAILKFCYQRSIAMYYIAAYNSIIIYTYISANYRHVILRNYTELLEANLSFVYSVDCLHM